MPGEPERWSLRGSPPLPSHSCLLSACQTCTGCSNDLTRDFQNQEKEEQSSLLTWVLQKCWPLRSECEQGGGVYRKLKEARDENKELRFGRVAENL